MSLPTFVHLAYSPWSLRAQWALAHHRVEYRGVLYKPTLSEPWLRLKLRKLRGAVTVPVWFDGGRVLTDSLEIAREAERRGSGSPLFPAGHESEIERWNERCDEILQFGRARFALAALDDPDLVLRLMPPMVRRLGPLGLAFGRAGVKAFVRKYDLDSPQAADPSVMRGALDALRASVGEGRTVLDDFSYADIVMCIAVGSIVPPEPPLFGSASRGLPALDVPGLADEYKDLVAWRDRLLERHHPTAPSPRRPVS